MVQPARWVIQRRIVYQLIFRQCNIVTNLEQLLQKKFGIEKVIRSAENYQISFDMEKISTAGIDFTAVKTVVVEYLLRQPGISYAVDIEKIYESPIPEPLRTMNY